MRVHAGAKVAEQELSMGNTLRGDGPRPDRGVTDKRSPQATIVRIDPETVAGGRTRYRLTLSCGCVFWELRLTTEKPPQFGEVVSCYATHSVRRLPREMKFGRPR